MNPFSKKLQFVAKPEITSGREAIRQRVWARWRKTHLGNLSRDLGIPLPQLEAFAQGLGELSNAQLELLAKEFFAHTRYDADIDRLVDISPQAKPFATAMPPRYNPADHPRIDPAAPITGARLKGPPQGQQPASLKRPGFA